MTHSRAGLCILHFTSSHFTSPYLTLSHLTSPHLTLPHLTSPYLTSPHLTTPLEANNIFSRLEPQVVRGTRSLTFALSSSAEKVASDTQFISVQPGGGLKRKRRTTRTTISNADKVELLGLQKSYTCPRTGRTDWKELQRNHVKWAAYESQNLKDKARRARKAGLVAPSF